MVLLWLPNASSQIIFYAMVFSPSCFVNVIPRINVSKCIIVGTKGINERTGIMSKARANTGNMYM